MYINAIWQWTNKKACRDPKASSDNISRFAQRTLVARSLLQHLACVLKQAVRRASEWMSVHVFKLTSWLNSLAWAHDKRVTGSKISWGLWHCHPKRNSTKSTYILVVHLQRHYQGPFCVAQKIHGMWAHKQIRHPRHPLSTVCHALGQAKHSCSTRNDFVSTYQRHESELNFLLSTGSSLANTNLFRKRKDSPGVYSP